MADIALARPDHDGLQARYDQALPMYRRVGDVLGEVIRIQRQGDIARRKSDFGIVPGAASAAQA